MRNRTWGTPLALAVFTGFIATSLWAKWNPAWAQEVQKQAIPSPAVAAPAAPAKPAAEAPPVRNKAAKQKAKIEINAKKSAAAKRPAEAVQKLLPVGKKIEAIALAKLIDSEINKKLKSEGIPASPLATDAEFYRRVHLDLVGVVPSADKVVAFLESKDPHKRQKAIDELLTDERFGKALSEVWSGLMIPRESNNRRLDHTPFQKWLAQQFNDNVPLDKMAHALLTATGNMDENGAVAYFVGNPTVDKMTDNVSKMFLGVRLECAQCHNHPFVSWKQDEYWGMAAFFMKTKLSVNPQQAAKKGVSPGIFETGGPAKGKKGNLPESAKFVPAKFLQGEQPKLVASDPYRPVLADWITKPENPFFTRAMVNRFWHHLFGRGLVNPVDDMHEDNVASHPELIEALADQLKASGFDLKFLLRAICNSEAYQRSSKPSGTNADDKQFFSHRAVRVLTPEQLYDSIVTVLGKGGVTRADLKATKQKGQPGGPREQFLNFFRVDEPDPQDYQAGIPQALRLMNSAQLNATTGFVDQAMKGGGGSSEIIERLYLAALSRRPTPQEVERMEAFVRKQPVPRTAYGDLVWVLMNSSEFALNH
jgi:hypothetical protein